MVSVRAYGLKLEVLEGPLASVNSLRNSFLEEEDGEVGQSNTKDKRMCVH